MRRTELARLADGVRRLEVAGDFLTEFRPNAGNQQRFFESLKDYREILQFGGNNSGKTLSGIVSCAYWCIPEQDINGVKTGYTINPYKRVRIPPEGTLCWISCWSDKVQQSTIQPVFDRVFDKKIVSAKKEGGAYHYVMTEGGKIEFRWQMMGVESYRGSKCHFILCDEPHKQAIYRECQARLSKFNGTHISTLTPVIDPDSPLSVRDIIWYRDKIVNPWLENPESRPMVSIHFVNIRENPYFDYESARKRMAGMSDDEIVAREEGQFILYVTGHAFNQDQIVECKKYLINHPEVSTPQYGHLEYDPHETSIDSRVHFIEDRETFSDKPDYNDGFTIKIWQHPLKEQMGIRTNYYLGVDAAGGKSKKGDPSSVYVKRGDTHQIVASLHGYLDEVQLAEQVWLLGHYYCGIDMLPAMVCIETTSYGRTTLQYLQTGLETKYVAFPEYEWSSIYHEPTVENLKAGVNLPSNSPGWFTSVFKRPFLVSSMRLSISEAYRALQDNFVLIPDIAFFNEAQYFIRDKQGVYRASEGELDDRLFSSALADMALKQAYNIDPRFEKDNLEDIKEHYYVKEGVIYINPKAFGKKKEQPKNAKWA